MVDERVNLKDRGVLKLNCLRDISNFSPEEWILLELGGNLHVVTIGTDSDRNRIRGFFLSITEKLEILYKEGADLCIDSKNIVFDSKMMREEILNFVFESALKNPVAVATSFPPDQLDPKWTARIGVVQLRS